MGDCLLKILVPRPFPPQAKAGTAKLCVFQSALHNSATVIFLVTTYTTYTLHSLVCGVPDTENLRRPDTDKDSSQES